MKNPILIKKLIGTIDLYNFTGDTQNIIEAIRAKEKEVLDRGYKSVRFEDNNGPGEMYSFDVFGIRPENAKEKAKRLDEAQKRCEAQAKQKQKEIDAAIRLLKKSGMTIHKNPGDVILK